MVDNLDLRCRENWEIGLLGGCYFVGCVFGNIFLSGFGDTIGRIPCLRYSLTISIFLYVFFLFVPKPLYISYIVLWLFWIFSCLRVNTAYIYAQEIVRQTASPFVGSIINIFDSLTLVFTTVYYMFVSKSYIGIHIFYLVFMIISCLLSYWLPESPKYLIS